MGSTRDERAWKIFLSPVSWQMLYTDHTGPSLPIFMENRITSEWLDYTAVATALFGLYFLTAHLGLSLDAVSGFASLVWPPTGIALAGLIVFGYRFWPAVFAAAALVNFTTGAPLPASLMIGAGNTLEVLAGAYLLHRSVGPAFSFERVRDVAQFFVIAALIPIVSATIGSIALFAAGLVYINEIPATWGAWWTGDFLGALLVTPFLVLWFSKTAAPHVKEAWLEILLIFSALLITTTMIFWLPFVPKSGAVILYIILLPLMWASLRVRTRLVSAAILLTAIIATTSTALGHGPFVASTLSEGLLYLQMFMGALAITFLTFSAAVAERREEAAENRRLFKEAQNAVVLRDEFIINASHELKTPLTSLKLDTDILKRELTQENRPENLTPLLLRVGRQLDKLVILIEDLLNISKIQLGKMDLVFTEVDPEALVHEIAEDVQTSTPSHRIVIEGSTEGTIRGDKNRLAQVLNNLLSNAIKYSPEADKVIVRLKDTHNAITVAVEDFGIGISPEHQRKIFDRFYRVSDDVSTFPGLGIGLYIAHEIVKRHHGTMQVRSTHGKGSTFSLTLPRLEANPALE